MVEKEVKTDVQISEEDLKQLNRRENVIEAVRGLLISEAQTFMQGIAQKHKVEGKFTIDKDGFIVTYVEA